MSIALWIFVVYYSNLGVIQQCDAYISLTQYSMKQAAQEMIKELYQDARSRIGTTNYIRHFFETQPEFAVAQILGRVKEISDKMTLLYRYIKDKPLRATENWFWWIYYHPDSRLPFTKYLAELQMLGMELERLVELSVKYDGADPSGSAYRRRAMGIEPPQNQSLTQRLEVYYLDIYKTFEAMIRDPDSYKLVDITI